MKCTFLVKVWHEDCEGHKTYADYFDNLKDACCYAVAKEDMIAWGIPKVEKIYSYYDEESQSVSTTSEVYSAERVRELAGN